MSTNLEIAKKIAADLHPTEEGPDGETSLRDIAITAIEGGINYWAYVEDYNPDSAENWGRVTEEDASSDGQPAMSAELTVASIREGIAKAIANRLDAGWSVTKCTTFFLTNPDAGSCELVVQYVVIGEHVYA